MPTNVQARTCVQVCQMLSTCFRDIQLLRFDDQTNIIFIFAGEELQVIINAQGEWRFLDATEF